MEKEIWRPVRGFEDWAEISNLGQIHYYAGKSKRYPDERWSYGSESGDYLRATIGGISKGVHVWVYLTFVGDIPKGLQVNHIDEDKHNNCLDNLNLMTPKENCNWGTGIVRLSAALKGKPKPKVAAALSKAVQALNPTTMEVVMEFPSAMEAQRQYGFCAVAVSACCRNCYSTHKGNIYKGFIWQFKENKFV